MERHCTLISDSKNKTFKIYAKAVMMSRIKQIKNNFKLLTFVALVKQKSAFDQDFLMSAW